MATAKIIVRGERVLARLRSRNFALPNARHAAIPIMLDRSVRPVRPATLRKARDDGRPDSPALQLQPLKRTDDRVQQRRRRLAVDDAVVEREAQNHE